MILISVEGLDGSGKSTLVSALEPRLRELTDSEVFVTKEPGSPLLELNQKIREIVLNDPTLSPLARELLFYADALQHKKFLDLLKSAIVISDRGLWSHLAYLRGYLKTKQMDWDVYSLCLKLIRECVKPPDCVIYIDSDLGLMNERLTDKPKDAIESNDTAFYEHVLQTYDDLVRERAYTGDRLLILKASDPVDYNTSRVITYLQEVYRDEQLKSGLNGISWY